MFDLLARDTISGQKGRAIATIDGNVRDLFEVKNVEALFNKEKVEVRTLGNLGTQHKAVGYSGTGTMAMHYSTSWHRQLAVKYMKTGVDTYFTLLIENDDKSATIGKQTVALYNVNLNSTVLAKLDTDNTALDENADFTFNGAEILNEFGEPVV
jgi:hypothetical protein